MAVVTFYVERCDEYVVDVIEDEVEASEDRVDEPLKRLRGIAGAKTYNWELKKAEQSHDSCFVHFADNNWYLVIYYVDEVEFGENTFTSKVRGEVL